MQGSLQSLVEMFASGERCLVIPVYQRNYDWKESHCAKLFDDLVETIVEGRPTHFFGSIVYKVEGAVGEFTVIDGQQRLTTVNLLFLALRDALESGSIRGDSGLADRIFKEYLHSEYAASKQKLKLKPVKADADAYSRLFKGPDSFDEDSRITANYRYFLRRVAAGELTAQQLFDAIRKLQVMKLQLEASDNAQLIFESLNSTGLDLSEADLIRNFVLMGLLPQDQEVLYDQFWNQMEESVRYDTSRFIRHYMTAKLGRTPRIDELYEEFKKYVKRNQLEVPAVLADMRDYARHYRMIRDAGTGVPAVDRLLRRYNLIDRDVTLPLLLPVVAEFRAGTITADDLGDVIRTVDTYLTRRFVCGYPTNALNKIFALLYREAAKRRRPGDRFSDVMIFLLTRRQGTGTFPTDQEFEDALRTKDFYHVSMPQRSYLFECLENGNSNDIRDIAGALSSGAISIEHIMPQTLTPEWRETLGPDYERIHGTWLHRLANLTVTGYNASYSNASFPHKRDRADGFHASPYRLNALLRDAETWGEEQLEQRAGSLVAAAREYWPTPHSAYEPEPDLRDVEPMGEDTDFTGRSIRAWEYQGAPNPVTTWKAMLIQVVRLLAEQDSAGIHRRASRGDWWKIRHDHAATVESGYSEVVPGIDVYTANSTASKMWILRDVFHHLGLDTDDLVFHLTPEEATLDG